MGQFWTIFNIDKGMRESSSEKFGEAFAEGSAAASLVKLLSSPGYKFPKDPLEGQPYREARKRKSSKTGLCDLPSELHDAIFAEFCDLVDIVAFCLTASHFWRVGLRHYKAVYMDHIRQTEDWSGDRLICMGEYAKDWPEGLISNERLEDLKTFHSYWFGDDDDEPHNISELLGEFSQCLRKRRSQWPTYADFTQRCTLDKLNPLSRKLRNFRKNSGMSEKNVNDLPPFVPAYKYDFSAWLNLLETRPLISSKKCSELDRTSSILRNLSKKVYVRQDALVLTSDDPRTPVYYMSFGSLILARIAWSTDSGMAMGYAEDHGLHRGVWAGDRFDIVNIEAIDDDGWTDVSAAARKQLEEMYEDTWGSVWEHDVRKWKL